MLDYIEINNKSGTLNNKPVPNDTERDHINVLNKAEDEEYPLTINENYKVNDLEREKESEHVIDKTEDEEYPLVNVENEPDNGIELDKIIGCNLCKITRQHICVECNNPVCNLFCSIAYPKSSNEMTRRHKDNDPRCVVPSTLL